MKKMEYINLLSKFSWVSKGIVGFLGISLPLAAALPTGISIEKMPQESHHFPEGINIILKTGSSQNKTSQCKFLQLEGICPTITSWEEMNQNFGDEALKVFGKRMIHHAWNGKVVYRRLSNFAKANVDELTVGVGRAAFSSEKKHQKYGIFTSLGKLYLLPVNAFHLDAGLIHEEGWENLNFFNPFFGMRYSHSFFGGWIRIFGRAHTRWEDSIVTLSQNNSSSIQAYPKTYLFGAGAELRFVRWLVARLDILDCSASIGETSFSSLHSVVIEAGRALVNAFFSGEHLFSALQSLICFKFSLQLQPCAVSQWALTPACISTQDIYQSLKIFPTETFPYFNRLLSS